MKAQKKDSVYSAKTVVWVNESNFRNDSLQLNPSDTSLNDGQNYNHALKERRANLFLGHWGTAVHPLFFSYQRNTGFNFGRNSFDIYRFTPENIRYYRTKSPFSNLNYMNGGQTEQSLDVIVAENIKPRWNVSLDFRRMVSDGDLQLQSTDHLNTYFSTWYQSKNKRYNLLAHFIYNSMLVGENGGLATDSIFMQPLTVPIEFQPVKFQSFTTAKNNWSERMIGFRQYYDFGRMDTFKKDTVVLPYIVPASRLSYSFSRSWKSLTYTEAQPDSSFYKYTADYSGTRDRMFADEIQNQLSYAILGNNRNAEKRLLFGDLGLDHHIIQYNQDNTHRVFQYLKSQGSLGLQFANRAFVKASGDFVVQGDYLYDYTNKISFQAFSGKSMQFLAEGLVSEISPDQYVQHYLSNHFQWKNSFHKTNNRELKISLINLRYFFSAEVKVEQLVNLIYFDSLALPAQYSQSVSILKWRVTKDLYLGKFGMQNALEGAKLSNTQVIRSPDFFVYSSLFYQNRLFKKVLNLRMGIDVRYNSAYVPYAYMPATTDFYLQNNVKLEDYPVFDFFAVANLKRARLFFKVEHINQGIQREGYFQSPYYPIGKRAFKLGVSWSFYD